MARWARHINSNAVPMVLTPTPICLNEFSALIMEPCATTVRRRGVAPSDFAVYADRDVVVGELPVKAAKLRNSGR